MILGVEYTAITTGVLIILKGTVVAVYDVLGAVTPNVCSDRVASSSRNHEHRRRDIIDEFGPLPPWKDDEECRFA